MSKQKKQRFFKGYLRGINQLGSSNNPISVDKSKLPYDKNISEKHKDDMFFKTWQDLKNCLYKYNFIALFDYLYLNPELLYCIKTEDEFRGLMNMFFRAGKDKVFYKYNKHIKLYNK